MLLYWDQETLKQFFEPLYFWKSHFSVGIDRNTEKSAHDSFEHFYTTTQ